MKTPLFILLALAFLGAPLAQAEPFPFKLHQKITCKIKDDLGLRDRDKDKDRHDHQDHDDRYRGGDRYYSSPRPVYYEEPVYYDPQPYRTSLTIQRTVVERPSYYENEREELTIEQQVQLALAKEGFYRGDIDGMVGPGTRAAIRRFQYEEDLPVTGRIDRNLLRELDIL